MLELRSFTDLLFDSINEHLVDFQILFVLPLHVFELLFGHNSI